MGEGGQYVENLSIPERIKSFVYLVGMLGFPIVVASYVLVVVSNDLKTVDKQLYNLGTRIDERPMGLDKSTDFIIYITNSLRSELQADLPELVRSINFKIKDRNREALARRLSIIQRTVSAYIRPIVRKHQRFAARFPSSGGNLGSLFQVYAPSEDISEGQTEAHLVGRTSKDVSEALMALIMNNIHDFGNINDIISQVGSDSVEEQLRRLFQEGAQVNGNDLSQAQANEKAPAEIMNEPNNEGDIIMSGYNVIEPEVFLALSKDATETITTVLRDQMLNAVRLSASEFESGR